tara:strand:+ start:613 stop:1038 length:426 start_codon:yes stop_codon:yes gene_type:complete
MKSFILAFLLVYSPPANAEEPKFIPLKKGQPAPFEGRLFNNAAVSKFIVEDRLKIEQCNIQIEYEVGNANAKSKYQHDLLTAKCEADDQRLQDMITIRNDEIEFLRKSYKPPKNQWWLAGGFVLGAASAIGIMYAVAPGLR